MSGLHEDDLVPVTIDIHGENRKMVEDIADAVLRRVLEEDEIEATPLGSSSSSSSSTTSSPLSINQLLSSSFTQQPPLSVPVALNPLQLALCQSLVANNSLQLPLFAGQSPIFPLFVPPPQPTVDSELLKIFQNILAKQKK